MPAFSRDHGGPLNSGQIESLVRLLVANGQTESMIRLLNARGGK